MNIIDWIIIAAFVLAFFSGLKAGSIYKIGSLIGTIVGIIIAGRYYVQFSGIFGGGIGGKTFAFLFLMTLVSNLIGLVFRLVNKAFNIIAIIPGLKSLNRLLGGVVSVVQRIAVFSILFYFLSKYQELEPIAKIFANSKFAETLATWGQLLAPLLPASIREVQSLT